MMMNRKRLGRFMAVVAVVLATFFLLSSILIGIGMSGSGYNLFELFGNQNQPQQPSQGPSPEDGIADAEEELEQNPRDPDAITDLAGAYYTAGRYDDAVRVLQRGREVAPQNAEIAGFLGQVYSDQAAGVDPEEQRELYGNSGDAFAAATEIEPENEDFYLGAGQAYEQADEPAEAIQYYNGYLDQEPNGQDADAVEERITTLLEGGESTSSGQP